MRSFTQSSHLRFALVCSITHYGKCPCMGDTVTCNLKLTSDTSNEIVAVQQVTKIFLLDLESFKLECSWVTASTVVELVFAVY